jgi:Polyketide cyclase / dehydrase and lipid transport.
MSVYRYEARTAASPERAFGLWTNLDRMHEWVGGVTKVTDVSGPLTVAGTTYSVWFGRMRSPTSVLEVERPRLYRSRFGNMILKGENVAMFEPDGTGTIIRQEMRTEGIIAAIFARIFASGSYRGSFQGELNAFAKLAEREPAER